MKENTDKGFSSVRERFKMDPPEDAWNMLNAELERKQGIKYKERGNRFKLLSIGLALLLISVVTYYYISTDRQSILASASDKTVPNVRDSSKKKLTGLSNKPLTDNAAKDANTSVVAAIVPKGGLGTRDLGHAPLLSRSSSLHKIENQEFENKSEVTANKSDESLAYSKKRSDLSNDENSADYESTAEQKFFTDGKENTGETKSNKDNPSPGNNAAENQKPAEDKVIASAATSPSSENNNAIKDSLINKDGDKKSRWSVEAFYSPNYYAKNNLTVNNPGYNESIADYNNREKADYSYASGLAVRYDLTPHWSIATGGTYSTIMYDISLPAVYAKYGSDNQLYYEYPTSCGNIEIPNASNKALYYGEGLSVNGVCRQEVKFISIPVTVRFQTTGNRLTLYADGGATANFVIQEKATMNIGGTEMTIVNNIDGLQKMNYGYIFGVGVKYNITNGVSMFIEPSYRGSITSLTENTSFYCYPTALDINTGLSYHF